MKKVYIIAEIGFNHNGDLNLAKKMIEAAKECGANAVKFQSFYADDLYFENHPAYPILKGAELSKDDHVTLFEFSKRVGIDFLSTPFSFEWIEFLDLLGVKAFKVASMDLTNTPFLEKVARKNKTIYLSTGASYMEEIKSSVSIIQSKTQAPLYVLHCVSHYPTKPENSELLRMQEIQKQTGCSVGFSDHTLGIAVPLASVALGAEVIEKHFTTDKNLPGPDNAIAANPVEMKALVEGVREIEKALSPLPKEENRADMHDQKNMRRGIYAKQIIFQGETITMEKLDFRRPEVLPIKELSSILGNRAERDYQPGERI